MANKVNLDVAQKLNITCRRGDTFNLDMVLKDSGGNPLNLEKTSDGDNEYNFSMQVRTSAAADGSAGLIASTVEGLPEGASNYILIEPITGSSVGGITVFITDVEMRKIPSGRYVYDLQYVFVGGGSNGKDVTTTFIEGAFVVNEDVTDYTVGDADRGLGNDVKAIVKGRY